MLPRVRLDGVLVTVAAALLSVVACHDATAPSRAPLINGPVASYNTVDSPDVGTVVLGSVNVINGSASATASIYYPYATIVKITATGVIYKNANVYMQWWVGTYPSWSQPFYPPPDASLGITGRSPFIPPNFSGGTDSSGYGYIMIAAGSTITGASRATKDNNFNCTGSPYSCGGNYCGPAYGNRCFNFSGSAGSFTIERQEANMTLAADSTSVSTGSNVKFTIRSTVDSIAGYKVPVQLDTAGWTPDPDSLGGKSTDSTTTGACTVSINPTLADCTRRIIGSGTVRIVAHINGKGFVQTQHIAIPPPELRLVCNGSTSAVTIVRGSTLNCAASPNTGSAITSLQWSFSGGGGSLSQSITLGPSQIGSANPQIGPGVASGTLTASGQIDGVNASPASVAITVNPRSLTNFQFGTPIITATVGSGCFDLVRDGTFGWTVVANSCDAGALLPNPRFSGDGISVEEVFDGPNKGIFYATSLATRVNVGSDIVPELKGAGPNYMVRRADPSVGACVNADTSVTVAFINACKGVSLSSVASAVSAHESCHRTLLQTRFDSLKASPGSAVGIVPAYIEAAFSTAFLFQLTVALDVLNTTDQVLSSPDGMDVHGQTPYSFWAPQAGTDNWSLMTFDEKTTC
jgi:hypothetical protein